MYASTVIGGHDGDRELEDIAAPATMSSVNIAATLRKGITYRRQCERGPPGFRATQSNLENDNRRLKKTVFAARSDSAARDILLANDIGTTCGSRVPLVGRHLSVVST